jgi:hypothetical protein
MTGLSAQWTYSSVRGRLAVLLFVANAVGTCEGLQGQVGSVVLSLECRGPDRLEVAIRNVGTDDTALLLGAVLGNGKKYMLNDLRLLVNSTTEPPSEHWYWPRNYPSAIGGRLDEWIEPLPARASYVMSVTPGDFLGDSIGAKRRLDVLPRRAEMWLRLIVREPREQGIRLLTYWTGTLVSNRIRFPEDCGQ